MVNIGGICEFDLQCNGTEFANVCEQGICSCNPGYIQINRTCYMYQGKIFHANDKNYFILVNTKMR